MTVTSGSTRTYSRRALTAFASVSSSRPSARSTRHAARLPPSCVQRNGTDTSRLRSPLLSSEEYSTRTLTMPLTITAPPVISRSRICSCPVASTMRFISGQYSGMAVSSASSCVAVTRPSTSNHVKSRHFSSKSILYHPLISPWLRASYESGVRFIPPRRKRPAAAPAESAAASRQ